MKNILAFPKILKEAYQSFLEAHGLQKVDIDFKWSLNERFDVAGHILEVAEQEKTDLIITGAKGHSTLDDIVFGSVTEKLVAYEGEDAYIGDAVISILSRKLARRFKI